MCDFSYLYLHQSTQQRLLVTHWFDAVRLTGFFEILDRDTALRGVGMSRRIRLSGENLNSVLNGVRREVWVSLSVCSPALVKSAKDAGDSATSRAFVRSILRVFRQVLKDAREHTLIGCDLSERRAVFSGSRLAGVEVVEAQQFMEEGQGRSGRHRDSRSLH